MSRSTRAGEGKCANRGRTPSRLAVLAGVLIVTYGCGGGGEAPAAPPAAGHLAPQAPVQIPPSPAPTVAVGQEGERSFSFSVLTDVEGLRLEVTPGRGLSLVSDESVFEYGDQGAGSSFTETVTVLPEKEGVLYLHLFITGVFDGRRMGRAGAVPVRTGPEADRKALGTQGRIRMGPDGRRILERPIDETPR